MKLLTRLSLFFLLLSSLILLSTNSLAFSVPYDSFTGGTSQSSLYDSVGAYWQASESYTLTSIAYELKKENTDPQTWTLKLYSWNGTDFPASKTLLQTVDTITQSEWSTTSTWYTYSLPTPQSLTENSWYAFIFESAGTDNGIYMKYVSANEGGSTMGMAYYLLGSYGTSDTTDVNFRAYGEISLTPSVTTLDPKYINNTTVELSGLVNTNERVQCYIDIGTDTSYGQRDYVTDFNNEAMSEGKFTKQYTPIPPDITFHFRAVIELDGTYYYGSDSTFSISSSGLLPTLTLSLSKNTINSLEFHTILTSTGSSTPLVINVDYATTYNDLIATPDQLLVDASCSTISEWYTNGGTLLEDTAYFARASAFDGVDVYGYSDIIEFKTYDSTRMPWVNWIENIFRNITGGPNAGYIWWLVFLAFGLIGLVSSAVIHSWLPLGIAFILGCTLLIITDTANLWFVALIALFIGLWFARSLFHAGGKS